MSTNIQGTPQCGSFVNVVEKVTGSNSAGTVTNNVALGNQATGTSYTPGTGTDTSMNVEWSASGTLAASTPVTYNLNTGVTDAIGLKVFAKVRVLRIQNLAAADSGFNLTVQAGASNGWVPFLGGTSPVVNIPPGSELFLSNNNIAGWAVNSGACQLELNPGANAVPFNIFLGGE